MPLYLRRLKKDDIRSINMCPVHPRTYSNMCRRCTTRCQFLFREWILGSRSFQNSIPEPRPCHCCFICDVFPFMHPTYRIHPFSIRFSYVFIGRKRQGRRTSFYLCDTFLLLCLLFYSYADAECVLERVQALKLD